MNLRQLQLFRVHHNSYEFAFVLHRIDCTVDAQDTIECVVLSYPPVPANNFSWLLPDADRISAGKEYFSS